MKLFNMRITKALIGLRKCTGWSAPLLFTATEDVFSYVSFLILSTISTVGLLGSTLVQDSHLSLI